ncbi:thioredoxin [Pseudomonas fluorescens]|uniref:thioredoxin family protein n=1 Tax=Pseudomonas fluorescens group TaxID=136843 RepID=UPI000584AE93|nr:MULTISPECIES: thioredoxin family protein [Pseudomonas fluorescens group]KIF63333.1 thioredoxin [Pseudomonas fluorescens]MDR7054137.1 thioredoxin 1 [Pseudomonas koreensis]
MNATTTTSALDPVYRKALKTWRPVILYFANEHCPACEWAGPVFRQIAEPYRLRANIYMLNTSQSPRHPNVTGTPTVLFYKNGRLIKKLKGIGTEETLARDFAVHIGKTKAPAAAGKPTHDLPWLRRTLRTLRTVPCGRLRRMF